MGLFDLVWNIHQQRRLDEADHAVGKQQIATRESQQSIDELRAAVDQLALVNRAIWELASERLSLTEAELDAKVEEIDGRDGRVDGKMSVTGGSSCGNCGRVSGRKRVNCMYCGTKLER